MTVQKILSLNKEIANLSKEILEINKTIFDLQTKAQEKTNKVEELTKEVERLAKEAEVKETESEIEETNDVGILVAIKFARGNNVYTYKTDLVDLTSGEIIAVRDGNRLLLGAVVDAGLEPIAKPENGFTARLRTAPP